ncbi:MAG: hypothetical protein E7627_09205 [Ruminococcaceae bacterium]|nr:hypothetical protein [Oscillospiraceae bacterium]
MKRIYPIILIVLAVLLTSVAFAAEKQPGQVLSYSIGGYTGDETALFSPIESVARGVKKFELSEDALSVSGEADEVRRRRSNDIVMACAYTPKEYSGGDGLTVELDLTEKKIKLNDYSTLGFGLGVIGGFEINHGYSVYIELVTSDEAYASSMTVEDTETASDWYMVYVDLSEVYGYAETLRVTVYFDGDTMPTQIRIATPFVNKRAPLAFELAERFAAGSLTALEGRLTDTPGQIIPTDHGNAAVKGRIVTFDRLTDNATSYFVIEVSGAESGKLTLKIDYTDNIKNRAFVSSEISMTEGGLFTIPVKIAGEVMSYTLTFEGVECEESFNLDSVRIYDSKITEIDVDRSVGTLDSITRKDNTVKFEGTVARDAAKAYSDGSIVFFGLTGHDPDMAKAVEIGRIKVSTRFEYTADLRSYPVTADTFMFMAAIEVGDKTIPISAPRYFDGAEPAENTMSQVGLHGAAPAGAFESNISHIIVDIPLDRLLVESEKESAYSLTYSVYENGEITVKKTNLSAELIEELDRDINFYISVGVRVYLRFTSEEIIPLLTYGGKAQNHGICIDTEESRGLYAAIVRYISERYSDIAGFVVGKVVNDAFNVGSFTSKSLQEYARDLAEQCRITYNAAFGSHPDISVIVPFGAVSGGGNHLSERVLGVMLAHGIERVGNIPWTFLYCLDNRSGDVDAPEDFVRNLGNIGISAPGSIMYFYRPYYDELMRDYSSFIAGSETVMSDYSFAGFAVNSYLEIAGKLKNADVVFMSLEDISLRNNRDFYAILKDSAEDVGYIFESVAAADSVSDSALGEYTVWDFSDKHHSDGWIAGGGVASCLTGYSDIFEGDYLRVLKTQLAGEEYGGAGITLCNLDKTVDLTGVDEIRFTFALALPDDAKSYSEASVVFVIGSDDYRGEFFAEGVELSKMQTVSCDLTGYEHRDEVSYIGVMIYANDNVRFELLSADAYSLTLSDDELADAFTGATEPEADEDPTRTTVIAVVGLLVAALTFIVIILLSRRDREERELRAESKAKRRAYEKQYK